ncbi:MAG: GNAT family N-acetyltransferase [Planctomycetes bacterium]|nr:GNAT family N-acetyltransferase [Planctomycetota bacterium]
MQMLRIEAARPSERAQVLRLALGYLEGEELARRVAQAQMLVSEGELEADGILAAYIGQRMQGALVCALLAGAGGLVWPPFVRDVPERQSLEDQLLAAGCNWLRQRGARLAEALLGDREQPLSAALLRNGFQHMTQLIYLHHDLAPEEGVRGSQRTAAVDEAAVPASFRCVTFADADPQLFRDTLLKTYEGTLDCPELNGVRTIDEIIAGHRSQGRFDPARWWLIETDSTAIGVIMLSEVPDLAGWDLSYVGVVPLARRQGWGRMLTQLAIRAAHAAEARQLMVAVDARNQPALNLYKSLGFKPHGQRDVYLSIWAPACQLVT